MLLKLDSEEAKIEKMNWLIHHPPAEHFVIYPINAEAKITHRGHQVVYSQPIYSISLQLPELNLLYHQKQFHDTVKLVEYFAEHNKFILHSESKRRFRVLSPQEKTPRALWEFAIGAVIRTLRQRKDRTQDYFKTPTRIKTQHEQAFKLTHRKTLKELSVHTEEQQEYDRVIYLSDIEDLTEWTNHVLSVLAEESKQLSEPKRIG